MIDFPSKINMGKLLIQVKGSSYAIPYYDILYLESQAHQMLIHTTGAVYMTHGKLADMVKQLPDSFVDSHKSYLLNLDKIARIEEKAAILENGEELPISKSRYTEFRRLFFQYLGGTV